MTDPFARTAGSRPLLGILTMEDKQRKFRGNHHNFKDIVLVGEKLNYEVYVVPLEHVKLEEEFIQAYGYNRETNKWVEKNIPLPLVLYNRIPLREDEMNPKVKAKIKAIMQHAPIQFFNPYFFNKWTLRKWLLKSNITKRFIPETKRLTEKTNLRRWLSRHKSIYLKPASGKAGAGIMKINKQKPPKRYKLTVQANASSQCFQYITSKKLKEKVLSISENEKYIIQQGIDLLTNNNRPFDLRLLAQKNILGEWEITGMGARIAGSSSITTHVPRGGSIGDPSKLISSFYTKKRAEKIISRSKRVALVITKQIEKCSKHSLGEMSLDLGLDINGKVWFFEANSKPMKFDERHIRKVSLERIIQYSVYLSQKTTPQNNNIL
ncbi:YheC/YheD family endospore coat-associated protein [Longirhabdus pacifica]|uniref:YheC/YheD family endospore coat-associated protein n=1 Tax=Longirhabdus pacifica TaxID=2305227 RepID=UPI0010090CE9|nr:YheC/YheD family protein [Longirhabdus pacifica]